MTRSVPAVSLIIFFAAAFFALPVFAHEGHDHDGRAPSCWLKAHPNTVNFSGGQVTLSWETNNADRAEIIDVGQVDIDDDSIKINVFSPKTYRMVVHNDGHSAECDTFVNVVGHVSSGNNYQNYYYGQPYRMPVTYVSLTQIPYTGFDFGPIGNAMYWTTLLALAILGAYLLVYQSGFQALATIPVVNDTIRASKLQARAVRGMLTRPAKAAAPEPAVHAAIEEVQSMYGDTMQVVVEGEQPRIVISRN